VRLRLSVSPIVVQGREVQFEPRVKKRGKGKDKGNALGGGYLVDGRGGSIRAGDVLRAQISEDVELP